MDSEQQVRLFSSAVLLVVALCLAFVVNTYLSRPWSDTQEMAVFQANRDLIRAISTGDVVICSQSLYAPKTDLFNGSAFEDLNISKWRG